jgi:uncharacterized protein (DUF1778 family)
MATEITEPVVFESGNEKLDVQFSQSAKAKLQAAAAVMHCSLGQFLMESTLAKAEETIAKARHCSTCGKLKCDCF